MQTVLVASSKGGCGKSTLATNLAACWAQQGRRTAIIDADPQRSSFLWCARRPDNVPGVLAIDGTRANALDKLPADTEQVLIDSAAGSGPTELAPWLSQADVVLVPSLPSLFDLEATAAFTRRLNNVGRVRRGTLPVAVIANRLKPWTRASQDAITQMRELPFPVVAEVRDSQAYVLLSTLGKGIFDYGSEQVRNHQHDWARLLRWIKRHT
ncbi:MAG TPA: ParA family protein [Rhodanobacteraceae bacterium]|jgi:chromosome partitioning protein|nr:ParA family protein [Rhodanobacteraceae bacterium]